MDSLRLPRKALLIVISLLSAYAASPATAQSCGATGLAVQVLGSGGPGDAGQARIALRTQQIVAYESGVALTVDPFAGSYFVEASTNRIEQQAEDYFAKIEALGGMLRAIERGWVQQEIQNADYDYQRRVETGDAVVVGVNKFTATTSPASQPNPTTPT